MSNLQATTKDFEMGELDTFPKILRHNAKSWPNEIAMREKEFGIWNEFNWQDYSDRVKWISLALRKLGVNPKDAIALLGDNRPEWVWGEVARLAFSKTPCMKKLFTYLIKVTRLLLSQKMKSSVINCLS